MRGSTNSEHCIVVKVGALEIREEAICEWEKLEAR